MLRIDGRKQETFPNVRGRADLQLNYCYEVKRTHSVFFLINLNNNAKFILYVVLVFFFKEKFPFKKNPINLFIFKDKNKNKKLKPPSCGKNCIRK